MKYGAFLLFVAASVLGPLRAGAISNDGSIAGMSYHFDPSDYRFDRPRGFSRSASALGSRIGLRLTDVIMRWRARRRRGYVLDLFRKMGNEGVHIPYIPIEAERLMFGDALGFKQNFETSARSGAERAPYAAPNEKDSA